MVRSTPPEIKEQCKGCYMMKGGSNYCFLYNIDVKDFICPCFDCLVKTMCRVSCDEVTNYFNKKQEEHNKKKYGYPM